MTRHFGHYIRVLHSCTDQIISSTLAQMDLTAAQGRIVGYLCHQEHPPKAQDLAEEFQLSTPTVSGLLSRLEKKGFIRFVCDAQDRRCKRIHVLPRGRELHRQIVETIQANEERMLQGFSDEEKAQFLSFLDLAIANMGGSPCYKPHKEDPPKC